MTFLSWFHGVTFLYWFNVVTFPFLPRNCKWCYFSNKRLWFDLRLGTLRKWEENEVKCSNKEKKHWSCSELLCNFVAGCDFPSDEEFNFYHFTCLMCLRDAILPIWTLSIIIFVLQKYKYGSINAEICIFSTWSWPPCTNMEKLFTGKIQQYYQSPCYNSLMFYQMRVPFFKTIKLVISLTLADIAKNLHVHPDNQSIIYSFYWYKSQAGILRPSKKLHVIFDRFFVEFVILDLW